VDTVMKEMADDFGEDFARKLTKLIEHKASQIAGKTVDERVGTVSERVDSMLNSIKDTRVREHFEAIAERHPDFLDVTDSLKAYIESLPEAERASAQKVAEGGSTRQVIKLLDALKASQKPKEPEPDSTDAAEGVRSRGLKLPEKPNAWSYEDAWDQF
jgi:non-homologous end joining protein Ku